MRNKDKINYQSIHLNYKSLSDNSLIIRFNDGDQEAFKAIVDRYEQRLIRFAFNKTRDWERSEDIVQETFLRVFRNSKKYNVTKSFYTWIHVITANLISNEIRNRKRSILVFQKEFEGEDGKGRRLSVGFKDSKRDLHRDFESREIRAALDRNLELIPPKLAQTFFLRYVQDMSYEEISLYLGINLGTVKSRLNRAKSVLASRMECFRR